MTPEEIDRSIQFLLAQQAQFAADLQQSRELSDRRHGQVTEALMGLTALAGGFVKADERLGQRLEALDERLDSISRKHEDLARRHEELAEAQKETHARFNSLMSVVERYFRERGGEPR
jgi:phage shock protein A